MKKAFNKILFWNNFFILLRILLKFTSIITDSMRNNFRVLQLNRSTDGTINDIFVDTRLIFTQIMPNESQNSFFANLSSVSYNVLIMQKLCKISQNYAS